MYGDTSGGFRSRAVFPTEGPCAPEVVVALPIRRVCLLHARRGELSQGALSPPFMQKEVRSIQVRWRAQSQGRLSHSECQQALAPHTEEEEGWDSCHIGGQTEGLPPSSWPHCAQLGEYEQNWVLNCLLLNLSSQILKINLNIRWEVFHGRAFHGEFLPWKMNVHCA